MESVCPLGRGDLVRLRNRDRAGTGRDGPGSGERETSGETERSTTLILGVNGHEDYFRY